MKKSRAIITIIVMIVVIGGCITAYMFFGKKGQKNGDIASTEEQISTSPIYTKDTLPRIDASLATQPLVSAAVKNFTGEDIKDEDLNYSNTHPGYVKLIDGEKDIIVVTEPSEEELAYAKEKGVELEVIPVVKEGFVFYVNGKNKVNSLTLEQIQKIYSGEITNWKEVGGDDEKIIPYQRPVNSGSQTGILSLVMKGKKLMNPVNNGRNNKSCC